MSEEQPATDRGKIIESFAPTGGRVLGVLVLVIALLAIVDILVEWRTRDGLTAGAAVVAMGALVWMSMVRPGVGLYDRALVIRNFVRDVQIPWHLITDVEIKPILTVTTSSAEGEGGEEQVFRSVAIATTGADRRAMWKARSGGAGGLSMGIGPEASGGGVESAPASRPSIAAATRIRALSDKNAEQSAALPGIEKSWARIEIAVFLVAALVAVVSGLL